MLRPPPRFTLFPYTTLFRSREARHLRVVEAAVAVQQRWSGFAVPGDRTRSVPVFAVADEHRHARAVLAAVEHLFGGVDRKSTRLNSSHSSISYAVFCLKKKK